MFKRTTGNLFSAGVEALVNPVNTVGVMGKGLALQFKNKFPENYQAYVHACTKNELTIGTRFVFERQGQSFPKYIINFPTKEHWRKPSKLEWIELGLQALIREINGRSIRSIAIPALGAGLGGLLWSNVLPKIESACKQLHDSVDVFVFEPN